MKAWVNAGAVWPDTGPELSAKPEYRITPERRAFWAFQPVRNPALPEVRNAAWTKGPIDRFILAGLEARGLAPAPAADQRTLIPRATFDLIGLPPRPKKWMPSGRTVRGCLRQGRNWLDVARYSDDKLNSERDEPYPNFFRYRDWVIQAFNDDIPFDLFVKAQIAAICCPASIARNTKPASDSIP